MIKIQRKNKSWDISHPLVPPLPHVLNDMSYLSYHGLYSGHRRSAFLNLSFIYVCSPNGHNLLTNQQHINDMVHLSIILF